MLITNKMAGVMNQKKLYPASLTSGVIIDVRPTSGPLQILQSNEEDGLDSRTDNSACDARTISVASNQIVHRPQLPKLITGSGTRCRRHVVRIVAWGLAMALATGTHYHFVHLVGSEEAQGDVWYKFATAAAPHRTYLVVYATVIATISSVMALVVSGLVWRHHEEPRFRKLLPPFVLHICCVGILVPPVCLARHLYNIYYIELGENELARIVTMFLESTAVGWILYALLAKLCVMYCIYDRGKYEVQYNWILLRIVIQCGFFHLAYLAQLLPEKLHWIQSVSLRVAVVLIVAEMVFYIVRLRNTRYATKDFQPILYLSLYGGALFIIVGVVLAFINPVARPIDQFNSTIFFLWGMVIEILGPPLWGTLRCHMEGNAKIDAKCSIFDSFKAGIPTALSDPILYSVLLSCSEKRFCEENVKFLSDGFALQAELHSFQENPRAQCGDLQDEVRKFLETYLVVGAATPVNLASRHLTGFRQEYATLESMEADKRWNVSKLLLVLSSSLKEITELIDSSGVLAMYNKSAEKIAIDAENSALRRLESAL